MDAYKYDWNNIEEYTTQLAKNQMRLPLTKRYKSTAIDYMKGTVVIPCY